MQGGAEFPPSSFSHNIRKNYTLKREVMCEFYRRFVFSVKCICSKLLKGSKFRLISTFWTFFFANLITPVNCWKDQMWNAFTYVQHDYHNDSFFPTWHFTRWWGFLGLGFDTSSIFKLYNLYETIKRSFESNISSYAIFEIVLHFKCDWLEAIFHMTKNGDPCTCTMGTVFLCEYV